MENPLRTDHASKNWRIHKIPNLARNPDPVTTRHSCPPDASIVIDNGSYECKVGWSSDQQPRLTFRCHSTKVRGQKGSEIYVGNDILNHEAAGWMPLKTPFEKNIASHPEIQEHIFDHIFTKLGFDGDRIDRSVVITEPLCNPNYYRQYMSELLFECYDVPSVLYGIDSVLSLEQNLPNVDDAVVFALGHAVSHVIPILGGEVCFKQVRRVSYGGSQVSNYLQKLLHLKHPQLSVAIGNSRSEYLTHTYCKFAADYSEQISRFSRDTAEAESDTIRIQLPLNSIQSSTSATTTSGKMDVCYAIVQRVENVLSKKHRYRLIDTQEKLKQLMALRELIAQEDDERKQQRLYEQCGMRSLDEVVKSITALRQKIDSILQSELPPEFDLCHFSDPDSWLLALRKFRENLKFKASLDIYQTGAIADTELLDRIELIIFETEREFKRTTVLNVDELKETSAIHQFYQIVLATEQYRAPEILFQPTALLGLEQAGLIETFDRVMAEFNPDQQQRIGRTVFITGGPASLPGLTARLEREILAIRPFRTEFQVHLAKEPAVDAWHGAKLASERYRECAVTKRDYEEFGPDYIKSYKCSNVYAPSPLVVRL